MGDGVLVEFASAVNAVACAAELQQRMEMSNVGLAQDRRIMLRIGVNLGDLVVEGGDLYGDGVNVAARLQAIAGPGQICVSGSVYDQVKRKLAMEFEDLGVQQMKNIAEPVAVYRVIPGMAGEPGEAKGMLPLPAKPSIAVLPFVNMSGEPEQESFVDGITEDLITDLSRNSALFVIARNSVFVYKGKPVDVRRIAQDLGVRYLVEGSARRAAGRVRINAQLIDAAAGDHLWAERFDRTLEDIFAVQDEVTGKIVEALAGRLTAGPARNRPASLAAYDLCVKARGLYFQNGIAAREACYLLERAIAIDPNYAEAWPPEIRALPSRYPRSTAINRKGNDRPLTTSFLVHPAAHAPTASATPKRIGGKLGYVPFVASAILTTCGMRPSGTKPSEYTETNLLVQRPHDPINTFC